MQHVIDFFFVICSLVLKFFFDSGKNDKSVSILTTSFLVLSVFFVTKYILFVKIHYVFFVFSIFIFVGLVFR